MRKPNGKENRIRENIATTQKREEVKVRRLEDEDAADTAEDIADPSVDDAAEKMR